MHEKYYSSYIKSDPISFIRRQSPDGRTWTRKSDFRFFDMARTHALSGDNISACKLIVETYVLQGGRLQIGEVTIYIYCQSELAKQYLEKGNIVDAVQILENALSFLIDRKITRSNDDGYHDLYFWLGIAYEKLGRSPDAVDCFLTVTYKKGHISQLKSSGLLKADNLFYHGLSSIKLGDVKGARLVFNSLINEGLLINRTAVTHKADIVGMQSSGDAKSHAFYMVALGLLGQGENGHAGILLNMIDSQDPFYLSALSKKNLTNLPMISAFDGH